MKSGFGFSRAPFAMVFAAPVMTSSAGWKMSLMVPQRSFWYSFNNLAAPMRTVVWRSWPQAWHLPETSEEKGSPVFSLIGSASISARIARTGPSFAPWISPMTPVESPFGWFSIPASSRTFLMSFVVSISSKAVSG